MSNDIMNPFADDEYARWGARWILGVSLDADHREVVEAIERAINESESIEDIKALYRMDVMGILAEQRI